MARLPTAAREDLLDALIEDSEARSTGATREALSAIAERIMLAQEGVVLVPRTLVLQMRICTCKSCSRSWSQEDGVYLLSTSRDGKIRELVLLEGLTSGQSQLPIQLQNGEHRYFPRCIRCYKPEPSI